MMRKLARSILALTGCLLLVSGVVLIAPTGAKQHFMKSMMYPKAEKMHSDLSAAMKLDDEASATLKNALLVLVTQIGVALIFSFGLGSAAVGVSLLALAASLHRTS